MTPRQERTADRRIQAGDRFRCANNPSASKPMKPSAHESVWRWTLPVTPQSPVARIRNSNSTTPNGWGLAAESTWALQTDCEDPTQPRRANPQHTPRLPTAGGLAAQSTRALQTDYEAPIPHRANPQHYSTTPNDEAECPANPALETDYEVPIAARGPGSAGAGD